MKTNPVNIQTKTNYKNLAISNRYRISSEMFKLLTNLKLSVERFFKSPASKMANNPNLENVFANEVIGENMCKYLDCKSILNVKKVSTTLYRAMEKQRVAWIRTVQNRFTIRTGKGELPESWKEKVYKLTTENLKKLGLDLDPIHDVVFKAIANEIEEKNPGSYSYKGNTQLHEAAIFGHLGICKFILKSLDDKNPSNNNGITPLHLAAWHGHEDVFQAIFNGIEEKNPGNIRGRTPLHHAVSRRNYEICRFIIDRVDEKNPQDINGVTPLALAHQKRFSEIVELFK